MTTHLNLPVKESERRKKNYTPRPVEITTISVDWGYKWPDKSFRTIQGKVQQNLIIRKSYRTIQGKVQQRNYKRILYYFIICLFHYNCSSHHNFLINYNRSFNLLSSNFITVLLKYLLVCYETKNVLKMSI